MAEKTKPDANVPLPDPDIVERSVLAALEKVKARRAFYITLGILFLGAVVGILVLAQDSPETQDTTLFDLIWAQAVEARDKISRDTSAKAEIEALEQTLLKARGTVQEGNALWLLGTLHYGEAFTSDKSSFELRRPHLEKAKTYLDQLKGQAFDERLVTKPQWFNDDSRAPSDALSDQVKADLEWLSKYATEPPAPDDDTIAVLRTAEGDIHLKFFRELAPKHVENFITLATQGAYNGTQFHFVGGGNEDPISLMGGDPYSFFYPKALQKKHILRWGNGGVGYDLPPEDARYKIVHSRGIVTSQRVRDGDWDNAAQFRIMIKPNRRLDRIHTPFAKVVEGMNVVDNIAKRKTASQHDLYKDDNDFAAAEASDLLVEPVEIYKVIIYKDGKALEHKFPLRPGEASLATLSSETGQKIPEADIYGERRLRAVGEEGEARKGLDVPFPDDVDTDGAEKPDPKGERS